MFYKVIIMPRAMDDIENIYNYILKKYKTEQYAIKIKDKISKVINSLDIMPERYKVYDKKPWESKNLRTMPIDKYIVCYLVDNDEKNVSIIRIIFSSYDIDKQLEYESSFYVNEKIYTSKIYNIQKYR